MPYHQRITIMGVTGNDPELKILDTGQLAKFSVCVEERYRVQTTGEKKKRVTWFRCSAFGKLAEQAGKVIKKGTWLFVEGRMRCRKEGEREYWNITVETFRNLTPRSAEAEDEDQTPPGED